MIGILFLTIAVAVVPAVAALADPSGDRARLREARRTLRTHGYRFAPGSAAERRALRIVLEGDPIETI
ncbi:hypothetical protein [Sediminicurvatus halobius]|uniref:Uncharacterized protein n=1 Tax=Sediminicurvatus halobius TaxID=2182432 RepID=A0A2U2N9I2_9GAMM|nr:hypothetical protein [Spiribacter halobius]PWG65737.1 hypothetical protein DEM34_00240 [Spiribacter halobius]UEX77773.1 hypothetical protein LMH63_17880 [Spiribacter halobius]